MSDYFLGEIRMFGFGWAPQGWALCNGATLNIAQNQALYTLLGTQFGGNGQTTFMLPDLRSRTPVNITGGGVTPVYQTGNTGGAETIGLVAATVPQHSHTVTAYPSLGTAIPPTGADIASVASPGSSTANFSSYLPSSTWTADAQLNAASVSVTGGGAGHANMQPFAVVNFCISIEGLYPMRN